MSKIEVDQVDPQSGTTLTLGTSGDTVSIPSGVTLANAGTVTGIPTSALTGTIALNQMATGTDGNIISYDASGNPVAVATGSAGQVLTSAGAGAPPTFAEAGGGITEADMYRLTADSADSDVTPLTNWERVDDATFSKMGTGISVSSGIFSFPSTGLYFVKANCQMKTSPTNNNLILQGTNDNFSSNDDILSYKTYGTVNSGNPFQTQILETFFNCTNVSTHKVKLNFYASSGLDIKGDTNQNESTIMFLRLGDSQ